ncbi:CLUMA_CG008638, isoform A [Clunio marinus]|uniref:CLUMA_CG008638, isoform A n=1 Tax=Clunio marinus TaxID=568069 RepID=A0A1J1I500_9DIPT|nr:CLUMA_CG008638, isoform A [Clunio marinus]
MTDYFDELNCQPVEEENTGTHQLMLMLRYLRQSGFDALLNMNMNDDRLPPAASKELVKNLESRHVTEDDEKCAICLLPNENLNGQKFLKLPCNHEFHDSCILPWLERTNSCPMCRQEMKTDDEDYEEQKKRKQRQQQRDEEVEMLHNSMYG